MIAKDMFTARLLVADEIKSEQPGRRETHNKKNKPSKVGLRRDLRITGHEQDRKKKKTESNVNVYVLPVENSLNRKIGRIFRGLVKD
ncbi:MAG TPA: hypothetical protein PKV75_06930 [Desulfobacterales bacterium]|nr:hypothetical protein [Desulfobacterales bacterium]